MQMLSKGVSTRADGSIIIDTKINTEKASKQLEQFGKTIVINSEKASSQMLQLENKIVKTYDRVKELTQKMQQMKDAKLDASKVSSELLQLRNQIVKTADEIAAIQNKMKQMESADFNGSKVTSQIMQLKNQISRASDKCEELRKRMEVLAGTDIPTKEYAKLQKELDASIKKHEELVDTVNAFEKTNTDKNFVPFKQARVAAQELYIKIEDIRGAMFGLEESGKAFTKGVDTSGYEKLQKDLQFTSQKLDVLLLKQKELQNQSNDKIKSEYRALEKELQYANENMNVLVRKHAEFQQKSREKIDTEYKALEKAIEDASDELKVLSRRHEELNEKQLKNNKEYSRMGKVASSTSKKAGSFVKSLTSGFKGLNKHVKTGNGLFGQMGTRLKGLALSLLVFNWISKGWNAMISGMKEGIQNLAKHSDEFNRSMSELKSSTEQAKNALATAFAPVISALIPYIVGLINIVNTACDAFARFWAYLSGKSTYTRAKKQNVDYAESLDGIANSAKKALGALAGFDELNVVSQSEDTAGGSGDGSGGGNLFEEVPIGDVSDWLKKLKEAILAGDWYSVGELIGQKLTEAMESIKWEEIYAKAKDFGKNLALFLNGLISPELFGAVGKTLAGAINTAFHFLNSFGITFDWDDFGASIATGIDKFFENWDAGLTGETFSTFGKGFLRSLTSFFTTLKDEQTFKDIGQKVVEFIFGIDWKGLLWELGDFFTALTDALINFPLDFGLGIAEAIWEEISGQEVTLEKPKWLENIAELILGWIIPPLGTANVAQKISDAIWGVEHESASGETHKGGGGSRNPIGGSGGKRSSEYEEIGENITKGVAKGAEEADISSTFDMIYNAISVGLKNVFWMHSPSRRMMPFGENILLGVVEGFKGEVSAFKKAISDWYTNSVKPWFTAEKWSELWENVKNFFVQGWNNIVLWWTQSGVYKWYNENVKGWFDKEKWTFNGIKEGLSKAFNDAVDALKKIWDGFKEWIADKLSFDFEFNMPEWGGGSTKGSSVSGSGTSGYSMSYLADGAVIRGGSPFMAVLGDQPAGQTNIETPLNTMVDAFKQAYAEVGADMGGEYTFIAQLDGRTLFKETVRRNQMYKKTTGQSAYT